MQYAVRFVEDEELPPSYDWALIRAGDSVCAVIKSSRLTTRVLEDAWLGYRALAHARGLVAVS